MVSVSDRIGFNGSEFTLRLAPEPTREAFACKTNERDKRKVEPPLIAQRATIDSISGNGRRATEAEPGISSGSYGENVAQGVAKDLVVYHRRPGAQSQFSAPLEVNASSDRVAQAISFAREHLDEPLTVEQLAEKANPSPRQFARIFPEETGCTPAKVVAQTPVEAARIRLE